MKVNVQKVSFLLFKVFLDLVQQSFQNFTEFWPQFCIIFPTLFDEDRKGKRHALVYVWSQLVVGHFDCNLDGGTSFLHVHSLHGFFLMEHLPQNQRIGVHVHFMVVFLADQNFWSYERRSSNCCLC